MNLPNHKLLIFVKQIQNIAAVNIKFLAVGYILFNRTTSFPYICHVGTYVKRRQYIYIYMYTDMKVSVI